MRQLLIRLGIQIKSQQVLIGPTMIQILFQGEVILLMVHMLLIQWLQMGTSQMVVLKGLHQVIN